MKPLVSIIIPAYSRPDELNHSINSVINQSYENIEIIIIDDFSSIELKKTIEKFCDSRIQYYKLNENVGVTESRKYGIEKSNGEYITFLDDDDYMEPNCIQEKVDIFLNSNNLNLVISDYTENNLVAGNKFNCSLEFFFKDFPIEICKRPGPFFQCCLFKSSLLIDYNSLFDKKAIPSEDWDFFINLSKVELKVGYINQSHFTWNISKNSQSANYKNEADGLKYIILKHRNLILKRVGKSIYSDHFRMVGRVYEKAQKIKDAKMNYHEAFLINPINIKNIFYKIISNLNDNQFSKMAKLLRLIRKSPLA